MARRRNRKPEAMDRSPTEIALRSSAGWRDLLGGKEARARKHHERQKEPDARESSRRAVVPAEGSGSALALGLGRVDLG